jgi:hypothetical protein
MIRIDDYPTAPPAFKEAREIQEAASSHSRVPLKDARVLYQDSGTVTTIMIPMTANKSR